MNRTSAPLPLFALWLAVGCGAAPVTLSGRVLDRAGTVIAQAEVATEPDTDVVVTNRSGQFVLRHRLDASGEELPIEPGVYTLKVKKFGFADAVVEVEVVEGPVRVGDITLAPRSPDIDDTAPDATQDKNYQNDTTSTPKVGI